MKRRVLILFCLILAAFVSAESGRWELTPRIIELPGGLVLDPEAPGAVEYRGITALRFLKEDLAVVEISGRGVSAFYETTELDAQGLRLDLRFKDDRILSLELVKKAKDRYLYLYRMPEGFFPSPLREAPGDVPSQESPSEMEAPVEVPTEPEISRGGKGSPGSDTPEEGEAGDLPMILVFGEMIKIEP